MGKSRANPNRRGHLLCAALLFPLVLSPGCTLDRNRPVTAVPSSAAPQSSQPAAQFPPLPAAPSAPPSAAWPLPQAATQVILAAYTEAAPVNPAESRLVANFAEPRTSAVAPEGAAPMPPPDGGQENSLPLPPQELVAGAMPIDLPTALQLVDANNLTVALAQQRVREAMQRQRQAQVLWLPNLSAGPTYNRYDGRDQNSNGTIFTVSKQSLFVGGSAVLDWDTSQVFFAPLAAQRETEAANAAARAVSSNTQLQAALDYLDLLQVYGSLAVNADTLARADDMLHNAEAAEKAGLSKTTADINRARSEVQVRRVERLQLMAQAGVVSARLAHVLLLRPSVVLRPADPKIVPVTFVEESPGVDELVNIGLTNRPELQEGSAAAAAAQARWRQAQLAPFIPHFAVTYNGGTFGGGVDSQLSDFGAAGYGQATAYWELHNLGAGDAALARTRETQLDEASIALADLRAQVAEDVTAAYRDVQASWQSLESAQLAVEQASETWRRLRAASFGLVGAEHQYDPLQPLIAERDLAQARLDYLGAVIDYDKAQVRLYWSLGQPPREGIGQFHEQKLHVPVIPAPYREEVPAPPRAAPK